MEHQCFPYIGIDSAPTSWKDHLIEEPVATLKQNFVRCVKGPNLLKTIVVMACTALVIQQVSVSIQKLIVKPITTYTHFDFNKTILYPSLTFCREPAYKFDKLEEYGLYLHPRYTSAWSSFNFSRIPLDQLWDEITYNEKDFFVQYGLNGWPDNVNISSTMSFERGRCYTMSPKILNTEATKTSGYSITLQHTEEDLVSINNIDPPGYHIYVHFMMEPFTEVEVYNGGLVDYLYVNTGETVDVKLTVDEYLMITEDQDPCTDAGNYSANVCTTQYVWDRVHEDVDCSGPWMISDLPFCNDFQSMRKLISNYMNVYLSHNCSTCPRFCHSYLYNAYVTSRHMGLAWDSGTGQWGAKTGAAALQTQVYFHFNAMMVSVYEERHNYDWNLFIADLGGSVGFLLGLSVIGLTTIVGKTYFSLIRPFIKSCRKKQSCRITVPEATVNGNNDIIYKKNEWNNINK